MKAIAKVLKYLTPKDEFDFVMIFIGLISGVLLFLYVNNVL